MTDYLINTSPCNYCYHHDACNAWVGHCSNLYTDFEYSVKNCPYFSSNLIEATEEEKKESFYDLVRKQYLEAIKLDSIYIKLKNEIIQRAKLGHSNLILSEDGDYKNLYNLICTDSSRKSEIINKLKNDGFQTIIVYPCPLGVYW